MDNLNKMINSVVYRYKQIVDKHEKEDLRQEARIAILGINVDKDPDVAYNKARDAVVVYLRKRQRFNKGVDFYPDLSIEKKVKNIADTTDFADNVDKKDFFNKVLESIPTLYKDILILYFVEEQTQQDIAKEYNKSQKWVCTAIKMALDEVKNTTSVGEYRVVA